LRGNVTYLTLAHVEAIHRRALEQDGGDLGIYPGGEGKIEAALMRPQNAAYYQGAGFFKQSAALFHGLITAHAYVDGNKRVAVVGMIVFLAMNGYQFKCSQDDLFQFIVACCEHENTKGLPMTDVYRFCRQTISPLRLGRVRRYIRNLQRW